MFRVTALLLVAIAMQSAAIAQDAKPDIIQVRRGPHLAQVGPLPDCDQARGRNSIPWNSDMPAPPAIGLRITDPNKDPLTSHEYPAPSEKSSSFPLGWIRATPGTRSMRNYPSGQRQVTIHRR